MFIFASNTQQLCLTSEGNNKQSFMKRLAFIILLALIPFFGYAQQKNVTVTLRSGAVVEGQVKEFDPLDHIILIIAGSETKIPMSEVAYIGKASHPSAPSDEKVGKQAEPEDTLANFKGFLLAKGNNVYVYSANSDNDPEAKYDKAGAGVIKRELKEDGFWHVVDNIVDAHFTINYTVSTIGSDRASLSISSWRTGKDYYLKSRGTNESVGTNLINGKHLYEEAIVDLQQDILKGKVSKKILENFTIK